jgi:hypothetical protein
LNIGKSFSASRIELLYWRDGKPKMVRTAGFLVAPLRLIVAGRQKTCSCHFRRPFFGSFFGRAKKEQEKRDRDK